TTCSTERVLRAARWARESPRRDRQPDNATSHNSYAVAPRPAPQRSLAVGLLDPTRSPLPRSWRPAAASAVGTGTAASPSTTSVDRRAAQGRARHAAAASTGVAPRPV